jgi:hypothetical protein
VTSEGVDVTSEGVDMTSDGLDVETEEPSLGGDHDGVLFRPLVLVPSFEP